MSLRRRASTQALTLKSKRSNQEFKGVPHTLQKTAGADDPSNLSYKESSSLGSFTSFPWAKNAPKALEPPAEDWAVSEFFEKYVMYPCNNSSSSGFLEYLPCLFEEVKTDGRQALRWAVRAAAYASLSNDQGNILLGNKSLECYGLALSALAQSLKDPSVKPDDDYILMTIVVLDIFEVSHFVSLPEGVQVKLINNLRLSTYKIQFRKGRMLKEWHRSCVYEGPTKFIARADGACFSLHIIVWLVST